MKRRLLPMQFSVVCALILSIPATVAASSWTVTEVVSTESSLSSEQPCLRTDSSGNIHMAWSDKSGYGDSGPDNDIFYKRYISAVGWTETEVVSTESTGNSYNPSLAVDSNGKVHIAWADFTDYMGSGTDGDVFYKYYEPGSGWTTTKVVYLPSVGNSSIQSPSLEVDSEGTVHIAWEELTNYGTSGLGSGGDRDIFYCSHIPGSSSFSTKVVSAESTLASYEPSLAIDSGGNIQIAWRDFSDYLGHGTDEDIHYKRYEPGSGWTTTEVVSTVSSERSYHPSLDVDANGNVHIAWVDSENYGGSGSDKDIFYRCYEPGTGWTGIEIVSVESPNDSWGHPALTVDLGGNIHIAWEDKTNITPNWPIFYRRYESGSGWTSTEIISTESTSRCHQPSLDADLCGNIHAAWADFSNYMGSGGDDDIFYKRYETAPGGLLQHWKLDEGEGSITYNAVDPSKYGTIYGPLWINRNPGYALSFDGSDDYISLPRLKGGAELPTELTVFAWIKSSLLQAFGPVIYSGDNVEYIFFTDYNNLVFGMRFVEASEPVWSVVRAFGITADEWHAAAGVWDGGNLMLYVDGEFIDSNDLDSSLLYDPEIMYHRIGNGVYDGSSGYYAGDVDDVRIYNTALNEREISCLSLVCDIDWDGFADMSDNCYTIYNPSQTDSDEDGAGNFCDQNCPSLDELNPVGFLDFTILADNWQIADANFEDGDLNMDDNVDIDDLAVFVNYWLTDCYYE